MKKKFLTLIFAICLIIPAMFMLNACGKDNEPPQEPQTIMITYYSEYGDLSFEVKEVELNNGKYLLTESDLPTISNEGDERIFDYWADENDIEFDFSNNITMDLELYAVFEDAEMVWTYKWDQYDDFGSTLYTWTLGSGTNMGEVLKNPFGFNPSYKKISAEDCLDEYITKQEYLTYYDDTISGSCFTTSSNGETKIVTINDITNNTYFYVNYVFIDDKGYGISGRLPVGVSLDNGKLGGLDWFEELQDYHYSASLKIVDITNHEIRYTDYSVKGSFPDITMEDILNSATNEENFNYNTLHMCSKFIIFNNV